MLQSEQRRLTMALLNHSLSCMKQEELSRNYYDTNEELQRGVDEYVEIFNNMRSHQ